MNNDCVILPAIARRSVKGPVAVLAGVVILFLAIHILELQMKEAALSYSVSITAAKFMLLLLLLASLLGIFVIAYFLPPPVVGHIVVQKDCLWVGNRKFPLYEIERLEIIYDGAKYDVYLHDFFFSFVSGKSNYLIIYRKDGTAQKVPFFVKKDRNFRPLEEFIEYWNQTYHNISYSKHQEKIV